MTLDGVVPCNEVSTTITVRIVFPAPGMPGQKGVCLLIFSHAWYSAESKSYSPVPGCCLLR
jgi:hypothetical protein